jgi:hypothetical protein
MIFKKEANCPNCQSKGKKISSKKMLNHIKDISAIDIIFQYYICKNEDCDIVYFNINNKFLTTQLNKEVGYKNSSSKKADICYCYDIKKDELNKNTLNKIEAKMQKFSCYCQIRNPYGKCCMSEIKKLMNKTFDNENITT